MIIYCTAQLTSPPKEIRQYIPPESPWPTFSNRLLYECHHFLKEGFISRQKKETISKNGVDFQGTLEIGYFSVRCTFCKAHHFWGIEYRFVRRTCKGLLPESFSTRLKDNQGNNKRLEQASGCSLYFR